MAYPVVQFVESLDSFFDYEVVWRRTCEMMIEKSTAIDEESFDNFHGLEAADEFTRFKQRTLRAKETLRKAREGCS
jgi:hypothetical protein